MKEGQHQRDGKLGFFFHMMEDGVMFGMGIGRRGHEWKFIISDYGLTGAWQITGLQRALNTKGGKRSANGKQTVGAMASFEGEK